MRAAKRTIELQSRRKICEKGRHPHRLYIFIILFHPSRSRRAKTRGILTDSSLSDFEQSPQIFGGGKQLTNNNNNLPYKIVLNFVSCSTFRNLQKTRKKTKQVKAKKCLPFSVNDFLAAAFPVCLLPFIDLEPHQKSDT